MNSLPKEFYVVAFMAAMFWLTYVVAASAPKTMYAPSQKGGVSSHKKQDSKRTQFCPQDWSGNCRREAA